jgi:hypothetical protein
LELTSLDSEVDKALEGATNVLEEQESLFKAKEKARVFIDKKRQDVGSIDWVSPNIKLMSIRVLEGRLY